MNKDEELERSSGCDCECMTPAVIARDEKEFADSLPLLVRAAYVGDLPEVTRLTEEGVDVTNAMTAVGQPFTPPSTKTTTTSWSSYSIEVSM